MPDPNRMERLRQAINDASRRLQSQSQQRQNWLPGPVPGDLYVFGTGSVAAIEWLVVRQHPDDPGLLLLTPADDFPLVGRSDVPLEPEFLERPLTVRCGESAWVPATACPENLHVGTIPSEAVTLVRKKLAVLARGNVPDEPRALCIDLDPEYATWLEQVVLARQAVEQRADAVTTEAVTSAGERTILPFERFATQPPAGLVEEPQLALAAKSGGSLLADLAESLAAEVARYSEHTLRTGGTLLLTADAGGVRVAWRGLAGAEPPALSLIDTTGRVTARWHVGVQGGLHRAEPVFAWADGQVVLVVGAERSETVVVQL
jgi:hypothetical protein